MNQITRVKNGLVAALNGLVKADGSGVLKSVVHHPIRAGSTIYPPVIGVAVSRVRRETTTWFADVALMLAAGKGSDTPEDAVLETLAEVDAVVEAFIDTFAVGGSLDQPTWDLWYDAPNTNSPLQLVGAIGAMRIRIEGPLKMDE